MSQVCRCRHCHYSERLTRKRTLVPYAAYKARHVAHPVLHVPSSHKSG